MADPSSRTIETLGVNAFIGFAVMLAIVSAAYTIFGCLKSVAVMLRPPRRSAA